MPVVTIEFEKPVREIISRFYKNHAVPDGKWQEEDWEKNGKPDEPHYHITLKECPSLGDSIRSLVNIGSIDIKRLEGAGGVDPFFTSHLVMNS